MVAKAETLEHEPKIAVDQVISPSYFCHSVLQVCLPMRGNEFGLLNTGLCLLVLKFVEESSAHSRVHKEPPSHFMLIFYCCNIKGKLFC